MFRLALIVSLSVSVTCCSMEVAVGSRDGGPVDAPFATDTGTPDAATPPDAGPADGGRADAAPPCHATSDCGSGFYCHVPFGMCSGPGLCEPFDPTAVCDDTPDFVCGCDGHTYGTPCFAHRAGIAVDHVGACPPFTDGCISDLDCDATWFCEFAPGSCGGTGTCTDRGIGRFCADLCAPQCACDGTSYQNECLRQKAAASLMQDGTCPGGPPPCTIGGACCLHSSDCMVGQECASTEGGALKCVPIPASPGCWLDDDCGTGHTCMDPYLCPCGSSCPRPDTLGTCV